MGFSAESSLAVAEKIGRQLCDSAIWSGDSCTWEVVAPVRGIPYERKAKHILADGSLYQGTAGIALFLCELCNRVANLELLRTARGAITNAVAQSFTADGATPTFSFHNGVIGTAYLLNRAQQLGVTSSRWEQIDALLQPLINVKDNGFDVIGGAAGAIPVLLQLAHDAPERDYLLTMARDLGEQLIHSARREPRGWSWGSARNHVRNLLGFAHGTAGIGLALLELFIATGETRYRYAARCAFNYEQSLYDTKNQNWPDFRHATLGEYTFGNQLETLRERMRSETLPPFAPTNMSAWCHGAPGVGLSRLRAYTLTNEPHWLDQASNALLATRQSLHQPLSNYSLCHGMTGNAETLLHAARQLDEPRWLGTVNAVAAFGRRSFHETDRPWPCGTIGGQEDPSLMLGLAGIGLFYLRLANERVPTPLLIEVPHRQVPLIENDEALRWEAIEEYFGRTLAALATPIKLPNLSQRESDLEIIYKQLQIHAESDERISEAGKVDFAHYEMMLAMTDLTDEWVRDLMREPIKDVAWDTAQFTIAPEVRVVQTRWNVECASLAERPNYILLHRRRNQIARRPIQSFLYLLLIELGQPKTVPQLVSHFCEMMSANEQRPLLMQKVTQQLQQLYSAGIVDLCDEPSGTQNLHIIV